jgi:hypothetical protein
LPSETGEKKAGVRLLQKGKDALVCLLADPRWVKERSSTEEAPSDWVTEKNNERETEL